MTRLDRSSVPSSPTAPVRSVHFGLGGFHRAHQAWYTMADPEWGIAAYTFRNAELPKVLTEQDGLYSLLVRGDSADTAEVIGSISRAHPGTDSRRWLADVAAPEVALITLTVTEAAYQVPAQGEDSAVSRLVAGLRERFRADTAPLSIVPCDNLPDNGGVLRSVLRAAVQREDPGLAEWVENDVHIASTVVDRITPAATEHDARAAAELTGLRDLAPVITEPFSEWLIAGSFPAGRPAWERAGAQFVAEVDTYQQRKLWFLNGAHTLLAYAGLARRHSTVREAVDDGVLAELIESWWDVAARHTSLPDSELAEYRERLRLRFAAPGIRHRLQQIAADGSQKIPARLLPVLRAERAYGRLPSSAVTGLAAWLRHLRCGAVRDPRAAELVPLARSADAAERVLSAIDPALSADSELVAAVKAETARSTAA